MADSYAAKRLLKTLPGFFAVTGYPAVDPSFYGPHQASVFRPYLWDAIQRAFLTEQGNTIALARAADDVIPAIYGSALEIDPATGTIADLGVDLDSDVGSSWTLTFVIQNRWDTQPSTASILAPFMAGTGGSAPRFGFKENTGEVFAGHFFQNTSGTAPATNLAYALGWSPGQIIVASLVTDNAVGKTDLWVNGILRATLNQSVKANLTADLLIRRTDAQSGVTALTNLEAYFIHDAALTATQLQTLHQMFSSGLSSQSRIVRSMAALAMAFAEIEQVAFKLNEFHDLELAAGGALTNLGADLSIIRRSGESDDDLRERIRNRLREYFSRTTVNDLIDVAATSTGLLLEDILLTQNVDSTGADRHAFFQVELPPGNDAILTVLDEAMKAAKAAGVGHAVGVRGSFSWDVEGFGWEEGSWQFVR